LLAAAEDWARKHGCKEMSVRSNVIRERAHKFYERNAYEHYKDAEIIPQAALTPAGNFADYPQLRSPDSALSALSDL